MDGERALEYRFVVERTVGEEVLRRAADHLGPDVHAPEQPVAYRRTLYVDSDEGMFLRTFKSGASACRARIRQYASAADRGGEARISGSSGWLEHKRSSGLEREKRRLELATGDLCALLAGEPIADTRLAAVPVLAEVASGIARGELRPCLLTWYRRWSLGRAPLRITLDEGIAYCAPEPPLAAGERAEPAAVVTRDLLAVLELKMSGATPRWLQAELADLGRHLALRHSKFRVGMAALRRGQPSSAWNNREFSRADSPPVIG